MQLELDERELASQAAFRRFVRAEISPHADRWDQDESLPPDLVPRLAQEGYLGALIPEEFGGSGLSMPTFGLLNEELGRGCSSVRSLLTVHGMVQFAITRWGSKLQKATWLPRLAAGDALGAFALSEAGAGSDAGALETTAEKRPASYVLQGTKKWVSFGQCADLFLVFARSGDRMCAFLVERDRPGLTIAPIRGLLGTRASSLATIRFAGCEIPTEHRIGGPGFGLTAVAASALDVGRYSVACGCVGIAQASLDASVEYASRREQFGAPLKDHQLILKMLTEMAVRTSAARWLCYRAGYLKGRGDPRSVIETLMAKYYASRAAQQCATDAVQIHGANGCTVDYPVQRYFRDAKIMEIIEGSSQIQEITIARHLCQTQEVGS